MIIEIHERQSSRKTLSFFTSKLVKKNNPYRLLIIRFSKADQSILRSHTIEYFQDSHAFPCQ